MPIWHRVDLHYKRSSKFQECLLCFKASLPFFLESCSAPSLLFTSLRNDSHAFFHHLHEVWSLVTDVSLNMSVLWLLATSWPSWKWTDCIFERQTRFDLSLIFFFCYFIFLLLKEKSEELPDSCKYVWSLSTVLAWTGANKLLTSSVSFILITWHKNVMDLQRRWCFAVSSIGIIERPLTLSFLIWFMNTTFRYNCSFTVDESQKSSVTASGGKKNDKKI